MPKMGGLSTSRGQIEHTLPRIISNDYKEKVMKLLSRILMNALIILMTIGLYTPLAFAGVERSELVFTVVDWNNCTDEDVIWDMVIQETFHYNETPSGQVLIMDHWRFKGTVEGVHSDNRWSTKGVSPYIERFSLNNSLAGGFVLIENALMRPLTPDTPTIRLGVNISLVFNASGELVVDRFNYDYTCLGKK